MKAKRDREEPCCICNHYHDLESGEPCKICGHVMTVSERKQQDTVLPTAIIPGRLYLGSYDTASRSEILKAMGITHILNTVPNNPALFKNTFTYHTASCAPVDFAECFQFIDEAINSANKVLVYCMTGVSRSPSVLVAYLMKHRGWRLAESYKWVKDRRPTINLKPEDAKRVLEFEMQLHGSCSAPMGLQALDSSASFTQASRSPEVAHMPAPSTSTSAPMFGGHDQPQWSLGAAAPAAAPSQHFAFGGSGMAGPSAHPPRPAAHFVFGAAPAAAGQGPGGSNDMEL